jgi:thiol:disulfide interchange protein
MGMPVPHFLRTSLLFAALCLGISAFGQSGWSSAAPAKSTNHVTWSVSQASSSGKTVLDLHAKIDTGWHLYSIVPVKGEGPVPTTITVASPLKLNGAVSESKPITKLDPNFNLVVNFFADSADFHIPVAGSGLAKGNISVRYQLCNDSTCIPPATTIVSTTGATQAPAASAAPPAGTSDEYQDSVNAAKKSGIVSFIVLSFLAGLLSLLTPCVFPMIPITVSFFAKRKTSDKPGAGLAQAVAYCAGIVGSFAVFGLLVSALFGASGIQKFATNPWVNVALAALFIVLALSLLGVYTISLPSALVNRFSGSQGKSGLLAPALMGLTFTLTSFTCTVPFVGTILAGASQGDYIYPLIGMLAYGSAFSLPFFLLALFPQYLARLPKSGSWLETVKAFMGFIEVAAALKFLSNADLVLRTGILTRPIFLGTWAVIAVAAGLFLLGAVPLPTIERPKKLGPWRGAFGIASLGLAIWFAFSLGGKSLGELEAFMPPTASGWIQDYMKALKVAQQTNKPILINFTGVTCTNCRWMEKNMFPQPPVKSELNKYVTVELYTDRETAGDKANQALQQKLTGVVTLPEYVRLTPEGQKLNIFEGSTRDVQKFTDWLGGRSLRASR